MLRHGGPMPSAALDGPDRDHMHKVFRETLRLAGDWQQAGHLRAKPPAPPLAHGRTPLPPTPHPSAEQRAHPRMGTGPVSLTTALQDLGRQLTCRHA